MAEIQNLLKQVGEAVLNVFIKLPKINRYSGRGEAGGQCLGIHIPPSSACLTHIRTITGLISKIHKHAGRSFLTYLNPFFVTDWELIPRKIGFFSLLHELFFQQDGV
jgi:hypothetical protein